MDELQDEARVRKVRLIATVILGLEIVFVAGYFINMAMHTKSQTVSIADNVETDQSVTEEPIQDVSFTDATEAYEPSSAELLQANEGVEAEIVETALVGKFTCGEKKFEFGLNHKYHGYLNNLYPDIDGKYSVEVKGMENLLKITCKGKSEQYIVSFGANGEVVLEQDGKVMDLKNQY